MGFSLLSESVQRGQRIAARQDADQVGNEEMTSLVQGHPPAVLLLYRPPRHVNRQSLKAAPVGHLVHRQQEEHCHRRGEQLGSVPVQAKIGNSKSACQSPLRLPPPPSPPSRRVRLWLPGKGNKLK